MVGFNKEETMGSINYANLKDEYQRLFDKGAIPPEKEGSLDEIITRMERNMARYQTLQDHLGIPWYFIAVIHERESSGRFDRHLHNGDPLAAPTVHRPAGRPPIGGPSFTWEESAEDALKLKDLDEWKDWSIPGLLYQLERYNGFGYRKYHEETLSSYLWSFSKNYQKGKYDRDGHFNPDLVDEQAGAASLLRRMVDLKKD
jgi:lysozyme family protein